MINKCCGTGEADQCELPQRTPHACNEYFCISWQGGGGGGGGQVHIVEAMKPSGVLLLFLHVHRNKHLRTKQLVHFLSPRFLNTNRCNVAFFAVGKLNCMFICCFYAHYSSSHDTWCELLVLPLKQNRKRHQPDRYVNPSSDGWRSLSRFSFVLWIVWQHNCVLL